MLDLETIPPAAINIELLLEELTLDDLYDDAGDEPYVEYVIAEN
jgi:hypothetical protein